MFIKNEAGRAVLLGTGFSKAVLGLARLVGTSLDPKRTPRDLRECRKIVGYWLHCPSASESSQPGSHPLRFEMLCCIRFLDRT